MGLGTWTSRTLQSTTKVAAGEHARYTTLRMPGQPCKRIMCSCRRMAAARELNRASNPEQRAEVILDHQLKDINSI